MLKIKFVKINAGKCFCHTMFVYCYHSYNIISVPTTLLYILFKVAANESLEPPGKRIRLGLVNQDEVSEEGDGALIINSSDVTQQVRTLY
jgi:hypothetical protein